MPLARLRSFVVLLLVLVLAASARAEGVPPDLFAADASYKYEVVSEAPVPGGTLRTVRLTSQRWQGMEWKHWLRIIEPATLKHPDAALLVIGGGRNRDNPPGDLSGEALVLPLLAAETGATVALLEQVPNQPLFDGLKEDALIAYTFQKYLETKDPTWPALVPMVKSAMRAMDAVTDLSKKSRAKGVERFFLTGASKRGWTTWLAAANDRRVFGIAPMVIDVLHMAKQMPHQVEMLGDYSEPIRDYTKLGLPQRIDGPEARPLLEIVDPYLSRERLTLPKLVVLGTNDPYWSVDAVGIYFPGLPGEKHIHYVPNAGHGLGPSAYTTAAAYFRNVLEGEARPAIDWTNGAGALTVTSSKAPVAAELFTARNATTDFRRAKWSSVPLEPAAGATGSRFVAPLAPDAKEFRAAYVALTFRDAAGREMKLCTSIHVVAPRGKKEPELF